MNLRDVWLRMRTLVAPRRAERELDEELAFHIERETQKHIANGVGAAEARTLALARFGPVPLAADQCRDARGTAFVDTLVRDISYAFRTFRRAPLAALTIVATVALGLGLVASVFTFFSVFFLRVDAVQNPGELFAVTRPTRPGADSRVAFARGIRGAAPRDQRLRRCRCHVSRHRNTYRGAPGQFHLRHRELLPGAGRPDDARAHAHAR